ncbi:HAMP domain-containing sensor histidine kinase [Neobacillus niacini]|uniref:HAMP domain-containing sensor histidine kinase n=1 Tax=Neobacillus niacini TaxID=86668 RepID=UPI002FFF6740
MKKYSHLLITKILVFMIMILCFTGVIKAVVKVEAVNDGDFGIVFDDDYLSSRAFVQEGEKITGSLTRLLGEFKNEEHIINGGTINEDVLKNEVEMLFNEYQFNSRNYNPNLRYEENYKKFEEEYADKISQIKDKMIKSDVRDFHLTLQNLEEVEGPLYYASDGVNVYTNTTRTEKEQFKTYPSYMIFEEYKKEIYPKELEDSQSFYRITERMDEFSSDSQVVYIAFPQKFLNSKTNEWKQNKVLATNSFYLLFICFAGFIISFVYLVFVVGRKSFKDQELHVHAVDKLYNDIKVVIFLAVLSLWIVLVDELFENIDKVIILITIPIAILGFLLILSVVKHLKNKTFFTHTMIYQMLNKVIRFVGEVYKSGSVGVKTVLLVIGYPLLVAATFFMFPITLGIAAWFAFKRVKKFTAIQEGVERIKEGDILHTIDVDGKGEFAKLASNINSITDGLKNAVDSELKSERLKTELITNVSHDIRTPLTSIITYVDLLKKEKDPSRVEQYIEVLDQKSKRLKVLTDDLFDAAKASSGTIPVHLERIDIISLISQGLGEVSDKIEDLDLEFKFKHPKDKVYVMADGRLLWRSIENVLSNIFKYALNGSRVYIDIEEAGNEILLTFKNISAYELNISADELMERFKRGDESRSSSGSGLGLSIAKSLIDIQRGQFTIQVDGDLFKSIISLPRYSE